MSIKKLLDQASTTLKAVKLSAIADKHRLAHYSVQLGSTPFARTVSEFVHASRYGEMEPHEASVQKSKESLLRFFDEHESMVMQFDDDGSALVNLTKRWIMENNAPSDLVALARLDKEAPIDAAVMSYVVARAKEMSGGHQSYVINEMSARVMHLDAAEADPMATAAFATAVASLPKNLQHMPFAVEDMVILSNKVNKEWPSRLGREFTKEHAQLQQDLRFALTSLAHSGNEKIALVVAQSADSTVQKAVMTFGERVGEFDPKLRDRIALVIARGNQERGIEQQASVGFER